MPKRKKLTPRDIELRRVNVELERMHEKGMSHQAANRLYEKFRKEAWAHGERNPGLAWKRI